MHGKCAIEPYCLEIPWGVNLLLFMIKYGNGGSIESYLAVSIKSVRELEAVTDDLRGI